MRKQMIKEIPETIRPRERLQAYGEKALSDSELLAILLRTGTRNCNALDLATKILTHFEDFYSLKQASLEEIQKINGIGTIKAIEMKAMLELGFRISQSSQIKLGKVLSSNEIGNSLLWEMKDLQQEHLIAIYLNMKNEIIKKETIFKGSLNQSIAHPREIFKGAVSYSAARIILAHNHPSGNTEPSQNDLMFTKRVVQCGDLMGIEVLDHIIVGESTYLSLREQEKM